MSLDSDFCEECGREFEVDCDEYGEGLCEDCAWELGYT